MTELSPRLNVPISTKELERRWKAVRRAMKAARIDALLLQNNNDHMGGYVKYFTDLPATNGYPMTVVFPADDDMTMVTQGSFGMAKELPHEGDGVRRGVKRWLTTPSYSSCHYTAPYDAELAATGLAPYGSGTIGLVGTYQMSVAVADHMRKAFPKAKFVDASDLVDRIKIIKSPEEQELIKRTAAMQDGAMRAAFGAIEPGMRDKDVAAIAQCWSQRHYQDRVIREGDYFTLLVEDSGPGGMYTELGRTCVLGRASAALKEEFAFTLEARQFTLDLLRPGTPCKTIWDEYNAFMKKNKRPEESRLYCHGQGYDLVERPLIRNDEPLAIEANTNIVVHPTYVHRGIMSWVCDNYLIGKDGPGDRLHKFPEQIVELG